MELRSPSSEKSGHLGRRERLPLPIQRADHRVAATVQDVGIDLGRRNVLVPQKLLNGSDVLPSLKQMGRK